LRPLGAALFCADLDPTLEPRADQAAYVANWLDVLKAGSRAIFTAASHRQRVADFHQWPAAGSAANWCLPSLSFVASGLASDMSAAMASADEARFPNSSHEGRSFEG
jgi:hypothetical protein